MASTVAQAYNGGLEAQPPVGYRGRAPESWELFHFLASNGMAKLAPFLGFVLYVFSIWIFI